MNKQFLAAATLLTVGLIAGCGSNGSQTASISGTVADGYLANATVFLDKNGNMQLDAGEPSAMTDATGAYTLKVDPADVGKYPIVAMAVAGQTIDMDNPGQTVAKSYALSMPPAAVTGVVNSNFISPVSSMLKQMMDSDPTQTPEAAMNALKAKLGMPTGAGTDPKSVLEDYMAAKNEGMHAAAQNIAQAMGQTPQVMGAGGTVDVNRYRGMMGAIFGNMSSIKAANPQADMPAIMAKINTVMQGVPAAAPGLPFKNMTTAFRKGMMGGKGM